MNMKNRTVCLLVVVVMVAVLGGCFGTSPGARFYTLTPRESRAVSFPERDAVLVRVGPVSIPTYIDRPQIVTRSGGNEILLAEYDRWSGALDDEVTRLLVNDLTERLSAKGYAFIPWSSVPMADTSLTYRIPVGIERFDGAPGEAVVLQASWGIFRKQDNQETMLMTRVSVITEPVTGKDYASLVAAMGKATDRLAAEMAESLAGLGEQKKQVGQSRE